MRDGDELRIISDIPPHNDWGAWARNEGIKKATGRVLAFMDDDDCYCPGAIEVIRTAHQTDSQAIHVFRMLRYEPFHDVIWREQSIEKPGNVSTQIVTYPNEPSLLGTWSSRYECDFDFLKSTIQRSGWPVIWHNDIIAETWCSTPR